MKSSVFFTRVFKAPLRKAFCLGRAEIRVLEAIAQYCEGDTFDNAYPSVSMLAEETCYSRGWVFVQLRSLEKKKLIYRKSGVRRSGGNVRNSYCVVFSTLMEKIQKFLRGESQEFQDDSKTLHAIRKKESLLKKIKNAAVTLVTGDSVNLQEIIFSSTLLNKLQLAYQDLFFQFYPQRT